MSHTETETIAQALEQFIAEKESLAARERELLAELKAAVNRLGYDLVPLDPGAGSLGTPKPNDVTSPQRRRGRPRKKAPGDEPAPGQSAMPKAGRRLRPVSPESAERVLGDMTTDHVSSQDDPDAPGARTLDG